MKKEEIETLIREQAELKDYINTLEIERQSLLNKTRELRNIMHEQNCQITRHKEDAKLSQVISTIDAMTVLKSSIMLISYVGDESATHRQKQYHTGRAIEMLTKLSNEKFESIKDHFDRNNLPF